MPCRLCWNKAQWRQGFATLHAEQDMLWGFLRHVNPFSGAPESRVRSALGILGFDLKEIQLHYYKSDCPHSVHVRGLWQKEKYETVASVAREAYLPLCLQGPQPGPGIIGLFNLRD